jgi:hypothetical protein
MKIQIKTRKIERMYELFYPCTFHSNVADIWMKVKTYYDQNDYLIKVERMDGKLVWHNEKGFV